MSEALAVIWLEDDAVGFIDQRVLPHEILRRRARTVEEIVEAIHSLAVRGAPAIGVFAAYGLAVAGRTLEPSAFAAAGERIRAARPTAVNLMWAVDRIVAVGQVQALHEARAIHAEQIEIDRRIALAALDVFPASGNVLTHCNTGPLATGAGGTALGAIIAASRAGKKLHVYVDETRPLLQGGRLTAFELAAAGVSATLIVDGAAAATMRGKNVRMVIVGADRIARNGDTANKIGTYGVAVAAAHHGIPFYVAAPRSTFDFALVNGDAIPIEERAAAEVRGFGSASVAPAEFPVYNPAFDVTPGHLVTAFITEYGVLSPPYLEAIDGLALRAKLLPA